MTELQNENETEISEAPPRHSNFDKPDLKGDWLNFFLLLLLYMMQIMPVGLVTAVSILLQSNKNVTYNDQALFSVALWPFSFKILWAPLVDSLYIQKIGRRKSWLVPVQFLMGACFIYMASNIDDWLPGTGKPNVQKLVCTFFVAILLAATQDIAVDGWGLTILKRKNVGYASTCQTTGLMTGMMMSSVLPVLLTSENFSNKYLRVTPGVGGLLTMKSILNVLGILFVLITTLIGLFKKEKDNRTEYDDGVKLSILQNYTLLWDIMKLPSIRILAAALLTVPIGFAAVDKVSALKLIEAGVSKENISIIQTAMYSVKIIIPLVVAKYTSGPKPLSIYLNVTPIRLFWNVIFVILIYYTPTLNKGSSIYYYYVILVFTIALHDILLYVMYVAVAAFLSRISDSRFGGTYMTLFGTLANLGTAWTSLVAIGLVDRLTFKECTVDSQNNCSTSSLKNTCKTIGGDCIVLTNGFYIEAAICTIIGIFWYYLFRGILKSIQTKDYSHWLVRAKKSVEKNEDNLLMKSNEL